MAPSFRPFESGQPPHKENDSDLSIGVFLCYNRAMLKKIFISTLVIFQCFTIPVSAKTTCDPTEECDDKGSSKKNQFKEISMDEALSYFTERKTGILFFGFENCPWCKEAKPVLKKAAGSLNQDVYYVKVRDEDHNLLYTDDQRKQLSKYIGDYMSKNKEKGNKLWLYVPLVIHVKKGKVLGGHEGTVKSYNTTKRNMTKKEKTKLKRIYIRLLKKA